MMPPPRRALIVSLIRRALAEDHARQDVTSQGIIPARTRCRARIVAREPGVLAGVKTAALAFTTFDRSLRCRLHLRSGAALRRGQVILTVEGRVRSILAAERVALNVLGHLCGIATLTDAFVHRARPTRARIFDTRKTLPGLRALEKYAVRAGGGQSHRVDLAAAVLIKSNHLKILGQGARGGGRVRMSDLIAAAIKSAKSQRPRRFVEIEVTNLSALRAALAAGPDVILLDNWSLENIRKAVALRRSRTTSHERRTTKRPLLEVSGGVHLGNVGAIARTGVERISIGRLTHSAPALDVALEVL